jgi:hypothetical protein
MDRRAVQFDPAVHLAFDPETIERVTISALGLDPAIALTDFAFSRPFRLLSAEGVRQSREELVRKDVQQNCRYATRRNKYAIRGVWKYSTFLDQLWKSPEIKAALSNVADFPIIINPLDWELAHVNVQIDWDVEHEFNPPYAVTQNLEATLAPEHVRSPAATFRSDFSTEHYSDAFDAGRIDELADANGYFDFWHVDDYPFVCIVMLSDPSGFKGGETLMRANSGELIKLEFPEAGYAILCQGRYVIHCARRAFDVAERICMIPSFLPEDVTEEDTTILNAAKGNSNHRELFGQWSRYRLDRFSRKVAILNGRLQAIDDGEFDRDRTLAMLDDLMEYLKHTREQLSWP